MSSRIFPCVILLLNVLNVHSKGTSSLTFVIDNTMSMGGEIDQVKKSVNDIMDVVFKAKSSRIQDMVLVTINDPGAHFEIRSNKREEFRTVLNTVTVHNEDPHNDWPEMSMNGTLIGLESSHDDSFIYVFTDAPPKDDNKMNMVIDMCQRKQSQVLFVITAPYLYFSYYPTYEVYYKIAAACSGSVYVCEDKKITESLEILKNDIQHNNTGLTTKQIQPNEKSYVKFTVDDYIDTVQISASGQNINIDVNAPHQIQEKLLWRTHSKVLKLKSPSPGEYVVTVRARSHSMVSISGTTTIFFKHGFSELEPKYIANTAPQPFANTKSYLSLAVTDLENALEIKSAIILTPDERVIQTLPVRQISKDFYVTIPFLAPSHQFKVGLIGLTKSTGSKVTRIAKIPITPAIPIKLPDKKKPEVEIMEGKTVEVGYKSTVKLTCTVYAYPKPNIKWFDNSGRTIPSKSSLVQEPYKYVSYMDVNRAKEEQTYTCYAVNTEGTKSTSVKMTIKDPFTVKHAISGTTPLNYGSPGVFNCDITSSFPSTIHWYHNGEILNGNNNRYQITDKGKKLQINNIDMASQNQKYSCKVTLNENADFSKTFNTRVNVVGIEPPHLSGDTNVKALVGSKVELHCRVKKGVPKPELTWVFHGTTIGNGEVLSLPKVSMESEGSYKCIGRNALGQDEHVTNLIVQVPPTILNTSTKEILATEGDESVHIPCSANGRPAPVITWERAKKTLKSSGKYLIDKDGLTIKRPQVSSSGDYVCVATNDVTSVRTEFTLQVRQKPQLDGDKAITAKVGTLVDMKCNILKGSPKPKISWYFMDHHLLPTTEPILRIDSVKVHQTGKYRCVAENAVGKAEHTTTLTVTYAPTIVNTGPTEFLATEGDESVHIPCSANGRPAPIITWELAKKTLENGDKYSIKKDGLTIKRPQVGSSGDYVCVATNDVNSVRTKFTLQVRQKPQLDGDKAITAKVGTLVDIKCNILKGSPKPKISWYFMDHHLLPTTEPILRIDSVKVDQTGKYRCVAENAVGKAEHTTTLTVTYAPTIVNTGPTEFLATEGDESVHIPCSANGRPAPIITWELAKKTLENGDKYSIKKDGLTIKRPQVGSSGDYVCVATNDVNSVRTKFTLQVRQKPQLDGDKAITAKVGTLVDIKCNILKGSPKPKISWYFMDHHLLPTTEPILRIDSVKVDQTGKYRCVAENAVGKAEHTTTLTVTYAPTIVNTGPTEFLATEGDESVHIPCSANGRPAPIITWELAKKTLENGDKYFIKKDGLTIKRPQVGSSGNYVCVATNDVTSVRTKFNLQVRQKPQLDGEKAITAKVGTLVDIKCNILKGSPKPKISWYFMDHHLLPTTEPILRIDSVKVDQTGKYRCVAENAVGKAEHTTTLTVTYAPTIVNTGPTEFLATEGDESVHIPCSANGRPAPIITWELAKKTLENGDKYSIKKDGLTIKRPQVGSSGDYVCVATNDVTSVRTKFTLQVRQKPQLDGEKAITAKVGTLVNINCKVFKGVPKPKISWYFKDRLLSTTEPIMKIDSVKIDQTGAYKCVAENVVGKVEHTTTLTVIYPPKIITNITEYNVVEGDVALRMPCEVIGLPKPKVQWTVNENKTTAWDGTKDVPDKEYYVTEDGTLIIRNLSQVHNGEYKCYASNDVGSDTKKFDVYLGEPSDDIDHLHEHYVYIEEGKDKNIECSTKPLDAATKFTRWFMGDHEFSNNTYLAFENATDSLSGNYTCRVGDINGAITEFYYVIVGKPPKFKAYKKVKVEWHGDDKALLDCEDSSNLESQVQWTYNNKVLTTAKSHIIDAALKWGHYTCNVTNPLGSISRSFEVISKVCVMAKSQNNPENTPLILNPRRLSWTALKSWMDYATLSSGSEILLSCPDGQIPNNFLQFPSQNKIKACCVKQDIYKVNDKEYNLSDLRCNKNVQSITKKKDTKCLTEKSETIRVGFEVEGFLENYEVCFDRENNIPLYSRVLVIKPGRNSTQDYRTLTDFKETSYKCEGSSCYAKTELSSNEYFEYTAQKTGAFIDPLNVVPYLPESKSRTSSWITIQRDLRKMLFAKDFPAVIWSGVDTLQKRNGSVVPRYLWKVLRLRSKKQEPIAIVHINDPQPTPEDIKCVGSPSFCTKLTDEYTYCCELNQFLKAFGLEHTSIGEPFKNVAEKIAIRV